MKLLGLIPVYNDADCIPFAVRALMRCVDELHVWNHGSTDNTAVVLSDLHIEFGDNLKLHHLSREEFPSTGQDGKRDFSMWTHLSQFALNRQDEFSHVMWSDADDLLREPDGKLATRAGIEAEVAKGVQVIRPLIRIFTITPQDPADGHYSQRMRYFQPDRRGHSPRVWETRLSPIPNPTQHVMDRACGPMPWPHYVYWPEGTVVSNNEWLMDQYPFQSPEQGKRKVLGAGCDYITPGGGRRYGYLMRGGVVNVMARGHVERETRALEMPWKSPK